MTVITTEELRHAAWEGIDADDYLAARRAGATHREAVAAAAVD